MAAIFRSRIPQNAGCAPVTRILANAATKRNATEGVPVRGRRPADIPVSVQVVFIIIIIVPAPRSRTSFSILVLLFFQAKSRRRGGRGRTCRRYLMSTPRNLGRERVLAGRATNQL